MLDLLIKNVSIVDGSGGPSRFGDIGVVGGRIASIGRDGEAAVETIDGSDLIACPGFIDPHTHYDAQLLWDPAAQPSGTHGVTTLMGGNCGFGLAPLKAADADFIRRMLSRVEGMPLDALEAGVDIDWSSFGEYLNRLEGRVAVNVGFMVGHSTLRRYVMGERGSTDQASPDEVEQMRGALSEALSAGGFGLSTSRAASHADGDGHPVPSRLATEEELLALCEVVGHYDGTVLEAVLAGGVSRFSEREIELLIAMSLRAHRPLNWNLLSIDPDDLGRVEWQLSASSRGREIGANVIALAMPVLVPMTMSFNTYCPIHLLPGWDEVFRLPIPDRIQKLKDPEVRRWMVERAASPEAGMLRQYADFGRYRIGEVFSDDNAPYVGRVVSEIAVEQGRDAFSVIVDIATRDMLRTVLWPIAVDDTAEYWEQRRLMWEDDRVLIGGSDGGAHVDRMLGSSYTTRFLADVLRGRKLVSLERAVQLLTDAPARLYGLKGRGRLDVGAPADLVLFDPDRVDAGMPRFAHEFPASSAHLTADSYGIERVLVNGVQVVVGGHVTGACPGEVLRSGRDSTSSAPN